MGDDHDTRSDRVEQEPGGASVIPGGDQPDPPRPEIETDTGVRARPDIDGDDSSTSTARRHPGVLVAKVGYFGVKSTKVCRAQMGTKPAKVGRLGPRCAKVRRGPHPAPTGASAKRSSIHAASKVAKVGAAGGPKLLKWGRLRARQGQIC